ncbi:MAG TPA: iron chelate uptake ABC transporter family permease subunit, partial [Rhizomicrobium sp.]|nr:iron chelate uptake ABC transporter family permease subunit [Rhizomicrobium sp.]
MWRRERAELLLDGVLQTHSETMPAKGITLARPDNGALITVALAMLALALAAISFAIGPAQIGAGDLFAGLFSDHGTATIIAREIRLPRALLALVVGAALGASGAALQGLFRNPLADPGVTGVTSSAGFGAVVAMYFGFAALHPLVLPASAIAGAVATSTILYFLSRAGAERTALILAGAAIASLATAMTALAMSLAPNPYAMTEMIRWMMGSLKDSTLADFELALVPVLIGITLLWSAARSLDAL